MQDSAYVGLTAQQSGGGRSEEDIDSEDENGRVVGRIILGDDGQQAENLGG